MLLIILYLDEIWCRKYEKHIVGIDSYAGDKPYSEHFIEMDPCQDTKFNKKRKRVMVTKLHVFGRERVIKDSQKRCEIKGV